MPRVCIGIPCFHAPPPETFEDYIRFAYHLGRRVTEYDFLLAIKTKSEQYRARNAIVQAALQGGSDYLLMLDDDHVIDWEGDQGPSWRFDFIRKLINHLKEDPKRGIVGALYYHRGGDCLNVIMKEGKDGGFYYMRDDEIKNELQEVDVQGGGCMLINMNMFSVIPSPWFEAESVAGIGTDMQICSKAKAHGYSVWCDTSIVLGHVLNERTVVTPSNRHRVIGESGAREAVIKGIDPKWTAKSAQQMFRMDAEEYLQMTFQEICNLAASYNDKNFPTFGDFEDKREYYRQLGVEQLARQVWFHGTPGMRQEEETFLNLIDVSKPFYGLDYGCGSAPIGFELVLRGHRVDFIDVDGAPAYEFTKWRAKHRSVENRCGWTLLGPYDYMLFMDSIEHIVDWRDVLGQCIDLLNENGTLFTNYFFNTDFDNIEHVSMDHQAVKEFLINHGLYPVNQVAWVKKDLDFMTKRGT